MNLKLRKWSIAIQLSITLFSSSGSLQKENKDILLEQLMDSLNVYKEKQDGERMILWLDLLKALENAEAYCC